MWTELERETLENGKLTVITSTGSINGKPFVRCLVQYKNFDGTVNVNSSLTALQEEAVVEKAGKKG